MSACFVCKYRPVRAEHFDLNEIRLVPRLVASTYICYKCALVVYRFSVAQGTKQDGSVKIRAVDNFSWSSEGLHGHKRKRKEVLLVVMFVEWHFIYSYYQIKAASVNGHYEVDCCIQHDHLDDLLEAMRLQHRLINEVTHV